MQASKARYNKGVRLDNPSLTPENYPQRNQDIDKLKYRAKLYILPDGQYEVAVSRPTPESIAAMGRPVRPMDLMKKHRTEEEQDQRDIENKARACRQARQTIRHAVKCIGGDHLLTLTYREVVQDVGKLKKNFQEFIRLVRLRYPEFVYVAVYEKQRATQEDWSYHLHLAVKGKQDIRWHLQCWLRAIGQSLEQVNGWYVHGIKLGENSMGACNVQAPARRFGGKALKWHSNKLAAYLTKYISKTFDTAAKFAKKYWAPKGITRPEVIKLWLKAQNYNDAAAESFDLMSYRGATNVDRCFGTDKLGIIWWCCSTARDLIGKVSGDVFFDLSVE